MLDKDTNMKIKMKFSNYMIDLAYQLIKSRRLKIRHSKIDHINSIVQHK
jgi:hypothetical protein